MNRVFLISAVECVEAAEQVNNIFRHLAARGNDVTLFDMSLLRTDDSAVMLKQLKLNILDIVNVADATILVTDEYCASLVQIVQSLFTTSSRTKRSSNVWSHNGVCCTILGGSVKKSRVAKHLWEVFSDQHELDLTDLFPYGSPKLYATDYTKETAQPTVV